MVFKRNPRAEQQLKATGDYRQGMLQVAQTLVEPIRRNSPPDNTGHYDRSVHTFNTGQHTGVAVDDVAAHIIEWGSVNNPPYASIRRGVRAAGLRLEESPKQ